MPPKKKLESMAYQRQQAERQLALEHYDSASIWVCSIENTAIRWGSPEIKELATRAWQQIKEGDNEGARATLDELDNVLEELLEED